MLTIIYKIHISQLNCPVVFIICNYPAYYLDLTLMLFISPNSAERNLLSLCHYGLTLSLILNRVMMKYRTRLSTLAQSFMVFHFLTISTMISTMTAFVYLCGFIAVILRVARSCSELENKSINITVIFHRAADYNWFPAWCLVLRLLCFILE